MSISRASSDLHSQAGASSSPLPPGKVFTIQIGCDAFKLSGASIASDAPSYFSQFFEEQLRQQREVGGGGAVGTLYIDRDPATFRDISRHLQGYHVRPQDGTHFVKLFADAQFYSLPRLVSQLFESEIFIQIGERHFQIPREVFSGPGDSPNFFSLGFAMFFASPREVFPGLDRKDLLRPPAIAPPIVSNRSGETFAELLHLLRGYPINIRNEDHRAELLRDCRYYHLRGLEQKLIPYQIGYDMQRKKSEIVLRLEDIRQSGIDVVVDTETLRSTGTPASWGWVYYTRPFVDDTARELIVEMGADCMVIDVDSLVAEVQGSAGEKITKLAEVATRKLQERTNRNDNNSTSNTTPASSTNPEASDSRAVGRANKATCGGGVRVRFDRGSDVVLDGGTWSGGDSGSLRSPDVEIEPPAKRRRGDDHPNSNTVRWIYVRTGQWRLQVLPDRHGQQEQTRPEVVLVAVKVDAISGQLERNARRTFLGGSS